MGNRKLLCICAVMLLLLPFLAAAEEHEDGDLKLFGLEAEKLLSFGSGVLAAALCILTFTAYKRTNRKKLIFITIAFFLFAVKAFLISTELFIDEIAWVDIASAFLDFAILLSFFYGVIRK